MTGIALDRRQAHVCLPSGEGRRRIVCDLRVLSPHWWREFIHMSSDKGNAP